MATLTRVKKLATKVKAIEEAEQIEVKPSLPPQEFGPWIDSKSIKDWTKNTGKRFELANKSASLPSKDASTGEILVLSASGILHGVVGYTVNYYIQRKGGPVTYTSGADYINFGYQNFWVREVLKPKVFDTGSCWLRPSVGSDFELFAKRDGSVVPAWKFLPYVNVKDTQRTVFADGWAVEMTPTFSTGCNETLMNNIRELIQFNYRKSYNNYPTLCTQPVVELSEEERASAPEAAIELGCKPSLNAFGTPPLVANGRDVDIRSAGFHVHWGFSFNVSEEMAQRMVKGAMAFGGVLTTLMLEGLEDPRRRKFYGRCGEYRRPNNQRIELRTLSSAVMVHPRATYFALDTLRQGGIVMFPETAMCGINEEDLQAVCWGIDKLDYGLLQEVVKRNYKWYLNSLLNIYGKEGYPTDPKHTKRLLNEIVEVGSFAKRMWATKSTEFNTTAWGIGQDNGMANDPYTIRGMFAQWRKEESEYEE